MILARPVQRLSVGQRVLTLARPRRLASSHAHPEESQYDTHEGFGSPIWQRAVFCAIFAAVAYKYAPEPGDDAYLTRWIALYTAPRNLWLDLNAKHTAMQEDVSESNILLADARLPKVHRYRYPQIFEQKSPFLVPVGYDIDNSKIHVKSEKE